jgi:hypothetical protein
VRWHDLRMGAAERMREVDLDVGDSGRRAPIRWSAESLVMSLPKVAMVLAAYGGALLWIDSRLAPIPILVEQNKEIRAELYHQADAARDLALRDQRTGELERRIQILETIVDKKWR